MSFISRWSQRSEPRAGDNRDARTYAEAMERGEPFVRLKIDVHQPIELGEFVGTFTALASEFDRFARHGGDDTPDATLFVRDVRDGCIVAEIIKWGGGTLAALGAANVLADFVKNYGGGLSKYLQPGGREEDITKQRLRDFADQVAPIASIPNSKLSVAAIEIENGEEKVRAFFQFDTTEAREIQRRVEEHKREIDHTSRSDRERVLLTFVRSDKRGAALGKNSGELVVIEDISDKPRPLIYASALAEEEIKHEITDHDSVYGKGFVVDVNVQIRGGKPVAYAVTNLHQVFDLPNDEG